MDWDNSYFTLSENNNYMIWHFLKICHTNGWIYKGSDVVAWCPRCETAISQHEILTEDYKNVIHKSVYFKLPIKDHDKEYLLVWTTTPWTIPANTAVAIDENYDYSLIRVSDGSKYWIVSDLIKQVIDDTKAKVVKTMKGKKLVGYKYYSPFDDLPYIKELNKNEKDLFHSVISTDSLIMPISLEEGTGLVHVSTSSGEEDHKLGKKLHLSVSPAIDDQANYLESMGYLKNLNAKDDPEIIIKILREKGFLYKILDYKHRYPVCWRCKNELVWKLTDEWYISMDKPSKSKIGNQKIENKTLREGMIEVTKQIKWIPEFGLERELDWLNNMHDWLISKKNRFWGLALPIWECSCGNFEVIGSYDELKNKAVEGFSFFEGLTPHKPQIDEVKIKCLSCGNIVHRIEPVGNPWLDAGIVAFSTISTNNKACLFSNSDEKPLYENNKSEWKKWFPADFITESFPGQFKNWFYSLIAMSTVLENCTPFKTVLGFATLLDEKGDPMHKSAGNMIDFNIGADEMGADVMRIIYLNQNPNDNLLFGFRIADEFRRNIFIKLENIYKYFSVYSEIDNWIKPQNINLFEIKKSNILDNWIVNRLIETEKSLSDKLNNYDAASSVSVIENFIDDLSNWYIRRSRIRTGTSSSDKVDKMNFYNTLYSVLVDLTKLLAPFAPFYSEYLYRLLTNEESVHLASWPEYKESSDKELIENMKLIRSYAEKIHSTRKTENIPVRQPLLKATIKSDKVFDIDLENLLKEEVNVKEIYWDKTIKKDVLLDTKIYPELLEEAKTRDLIRKIQAQRKEMGINLNQSVIIWSDWYPENSDLINRIKSTVIAIELRKGEFKVKAE